MSDVIVVMNKGRIEQMGGPNELYSRASRFVAQLQSARAISWKASCFPTTARPRPSTGT